MTETPATYTTASGDGLWHFDVCAVCGWRHESHVDGGLAPDHEFVARVFPVCVYCGLPAGECVGMPNTAETEPRHNFETVDHYLNRYPVPTWTMRS